jgi:hypothetical protein
MISKEGTTFAFTNQSPALFLSLISDFEELEMITIIFVMLYRNLNFKCIKCQASDKLHNRKFSTFLMGGSFFQMY